MPKTKLAGLKQQLRAAEEDVQLKAQQLEELREQVEEARSKIEHLEGEVNTNAALEDDVQTLLRHQRETAAAFMDYENRVLALELQGLVDRWRTMDIEELAQQNHDLREECLRLQQENMQLSKTVAENSLSARRDLARIESALELTVKEKMREMHDRLRQELYEEMDDKTKKMVAEHGYLQDYVRDQAAQAATLDRHCRMLQAERTRCKVDSDLATSLSEQQASHAVVLRRQLKQAYQTVEALRRRLMETEARAQAAWDEAVRASSRAAVAAAAAARAGLRGGDAAAAAAAMAEGDVDSAYGMAGEGAEMAALESQLRHAKQRFERMRLQRDRWRDRSILYEKACAQLQAALQTLQDQARLTLPSGVKQDLDAIWCAAKGAEAAVDSGAASSRPSTPYLYSSMATPQSGVGGVGAVTETDSRAGQWARSSWSSPSGVGGRWPAGGGAAAAEAARGRVASARVSGSAGQTRRSLPSRPRTAAPTPHDGSGGGASAALRAAEAIRAAVVLNPPLPLPVSPSPSPLPASPAQPEEVNRIREGGGDGIGPSLESPADGAEPTRGSSPGRVAIMSRLYSNEAEPFKLVPKVQYDQTGWPVVPELRPLSPNRMNGGTGTAQVGSRTANLALQPLVLPQHQQEHLAVPVVPFSPLAAQPTLGALAGGAARRTPGSMRPHSAVEPSPAVTTPRWTICKSLTGLTSPAAAAAAIDAAAGGGDAMAGSLTPDVRQDGSSQQPPPPSLMLQRPQALSTGPEPLLPNPVGTRADGYRRTVSYAAEADRQTWQYQRSRSQSPEYAAIARATSATSAEAGEQHGGSKTNGGGSGSGSTAAAADSALLTAALSPAVPGTGGVPEVGLSGGALYTVVHNIAVSAGGSAATSSPSTAPTVGSAYLHPTTSSGPQAAARALQAFTATSAAGATAIGTAPGPVFLSNPSALLAALRRPPSCMKRLHNPDVMFSGTRSSSARGGAMWGQRGGSSGPNGGGSVSGGSVSGGNVSGADGGGGMGWSNAASNSSSGGGGGGGGSSIGESATTR
ncbi:hypothetical protein VaNZ11_006974 [Volvox africanus]|uniref:Uncharacterized protein n=1 Tax=Volvox africanus TaxID=51714 RepID=A0ABQ5S2R4_9CHLO|nr:hypothetical protein VaNZ11_006974 [Volvox africanus]